MRGLLRKTHIFDHFPIVACTSMVDFNSRCPLNSENNANKSIPLKYRGKNNQNQ